MLNSRQMLYYIIVTQYENAKQAYMQGNKVSSVSMISGYSENREERKSKPQAWELITAQ